LESLETEENTAHYSAKRVGLFLKAQLAGRLHPFHVNPVAVCPSPVAIEIREAERLPSSFQFHFTATRVFGDASAAGGLRGAVANPAPEMVGIIL